MQQIKENVFAVIPTAGCNMALVGTPLGTLLVDTPVTSSRAAELEAALRDAGHAPIRLVFLTHHHGDHILGTALFGDALILANGHVDECVRAFDRNWIANWVAGGSVAPDEAEEVMAAKIVPPHLVYSGNLVLRLGDVEAHVMPLPGHTPGSAGIWLPGTRVLITGDALFAGRHPFVLDADVGQWLNTLEVMRELDADVIIPGHGPVCDYDEVDRQQHYLELLVEVSQAGTEGTVSEAGIKELLNYYPLHGRPEEQARERIIASIPIARRTAPPA